MTTHATIAAMPLPCPVPLCAVLFPAVLESSAKPRKITTAKDRLEDFSDGKRPVYKRDSATFNKFEMYRPHLSAKKWTSTRDIADALGLHTASVNKYLSKQKGVKCEKRMSGHGYCVNYWRLK